MELKTHPLFTDAGLIAYWRMNGDANDSSPSGFNGSVTGASNVAAKFGNGYSFAGGTNKITLSDPSSVFDLLTFSVSFWIKVVGTISGIVFCNYDRSPEYGYNISLSSSLVNYTSYNNGPLDGINTDFTINDGIFHHCCVTRDNADSGRVKIYVDGTMNVSQTSNTIGFNAGVLPIIGNRETDDYGISGSIIDDLAIFNRALTAGEIKSLYNDSGFFAFL